MIRRAARRLRTSFGRIAERWARGPAILLYHRIAADGHDPFGLCVSPAHFAAQLDLLAADYQPVRLEELVARVRAGEATRREVAITFDDGYRDNLEVALPMLQRRGIPATFFIASGHVASGRAFWWDRLESAWLRNRRLRPRIVVPMGERTEVLDSEGDWDGASSVPGGMTPRQHAFHRLHEGLIALPARARDAALAALVDASPEGGGAAPSPRAMTANEVQAIAADPRMEIGAHSVNHPMLTTLGVEERRAEIRQSLADLEAMVGRPIRAFAYPYGYFDEATVAEARRQGVEYACTCVPRRVRRTDDPLRLPRIEARNCGAEEFGRALALSLTRSHPLAAS